TAAHSRQLGYTDDKCSGTQAMQPIQLIDVMQYVAGQVADPQRRQAIEEARRADARVRRWFERCRKPEPPPAAPAAPPASAAAEALRALRDSLWVQLPGRAFPPLGGGGCRLTATTLPLRGDPRVFISHHRGDGFPAFV